MSARVILQKHILLFFTGLSLSCLDDSDKTFRCEAYDSIPNVRLHWQDAQGRAVIYRGMSASSAAKRTPDRLARLNLRDFQRMANWGATAVRLLVFWDGIEPVAHQYNMRYLAGIKHRVQLAAQAGLDVILDMHQDVYGTGFGRGGLPYWTCAEEHYENFEPHDTWFLAYLDPSVKKCFDNFWQSKSLQEQYANAVQVLVAHLRSEKNVVALEAMNEPWHGSYNELNFEEDILRPFYETLDQAIHKERPDLYLIGEPSSLQNVGFGTSFEPPFGCRNKPWIYAPHFYNQYSDLDVPYGDGNFHRLRSGVEALLQQSRDVAAPIIVSEYGIHAFTKGAGKYVRDMLHLFDEYSISSLIWSYDRDDDQGFALLNEDDAPSAMAKELVRPYMHKIPGTPLGQTWTTQDKTLRFTWLEHSPPITAPAVVVVPRMLFSHGISVTSDDPVGSWSATYNSKTQRLYIETTPNDGGEHHFTIRSEIQEPNTP